MLDRDFQLLASIISQQLKKYENNQSLRLVIFDTAISMGTEFVRLNPKFNLARFLDECRDKKLENV